MMMYGLLRALFVVIGLTSEAVGPQQAAIARRAPPDTVRGLYVNRWAAIGNRMWELIEIAKTTEVNALVIDVKDDRGLLLYRSGVPLAKSIAADTNRPMTARRMKAVLDTMELHGIHAIARVVVVKDPLLATARPELSIHRKDDSSKVWLDRVGNPWLDATQVEVWNYAADVAIEAVELARNIDFDASDEDE